MQHQPLLYIFTHLVVELDICRLVHPIAILTSEVLPKMKLLVFRDCAVKPCVVEDTCLHNDFDHHVR